MATRVKIEKRHMDTIDKQLRECQYVPKFYTVEHNDQLLVCEIDEDNPGILWSLGKICGHALTHEVWAQDVNKLKQLR